VRLSVTVGGFRVLGLCCVLVGSGGDGDLVKTAVIRPAHVSCGAAAELFSPPALKLSGLRGNLEHVRV
jgi:hypothetical protein